VSTPTREEFNRLLDRMNAMSRELDAAHHELRIQFERMAQLQADIDVIRGAWSKVGNQPGTGERSNIRVVGSGAK
jgi:hypothetical protein